MRGFLSVMVVVWIVVLAGLSVLPDPVHRPHTAGLGGTNGVLVPAGDDPGGH